MKIFFDNCDLGGSRTGPNSFARRIAIELSKRGHVIADPSDYEVALCFIERTPLLNLDKPYVQRLDGIWFKPEEIKIKNKGIRNTYDDATSVIFQSEFDRKMTERWFGSKKGTVIRNGIELQELEVSSGILALKKQYQKVFVCSSNWHRQKRLKENIELYLHLKSNMDESCCLIVLGSNPDFAWAGNDIYYTNASIPHEMCLQFYSVADWMIHLAWSDHCPNVVVEAISQGCPIICSETGGTAELVGENGLVLKEGHSYNFEAYDYDNPPVFDTKQISKLPAVQVDKNSVDITKTVLEYEKVLQQALESRTT
jgi:glycosyltransferase involved in cell wall biosynthesis